MSEHGGNGGPIVGKTTSAADRVVEFMAKCGNISIESALLSIIVGDPLQYAAFKKGIADAIESAAYTSNTTRDGEL